MVEALVTRLLANGGLRADDLPAIRSAALAFPARLEAVGSTESQVNGARLSEAVNAVCDRLDGTDWQPLSTDDTWRSARLLVAQRGQAGAVAFAWTRVHELAAGRDRAGVEVWCRILDALEGGPHDA